MNGVVQADRVTCALAVYPCLIVVPNSTISSECLPLSVNLLELHLTRPCPDWMREFEKWIPDVRCAACTLTLIPRPSSTQPSAL